MENIPINIPKSLFNQTSEDRQFIKPLLNSFVKPLSELQIKLYQTLQIEKDKITPRKSIIQQRNTIFDKITIKKDKNKNSIKVKQEKQAFLNFEGMEHVRINRARIHDWFMEICKVFDQGWRTFWIAQTILDELIVKQKIIEVENIHLYASVSFFIASKYHEVRPLKLKILEKDILYSKFSRQKILKCEGEIVQKLLIPQGSVGFSYFTIPNILFQQFPQLESDEILAKKILKEIAFIYMDPNRAFPEKLKITEKELIIKIAKKIDNDEPCQQTFGVLDYYLTKYRCENIMKYFQQIKL